MIDRRFAILISDVRAHLAEFQMRSGQWTCTERHYCSMDFPILPRSTEDLTTVAAELGEAVRERWPDGISCRIIVPSSACLCHRIELPSGRWSDQAALFEFEQYLPVELEALTCSVIRGEDNTGLILGVFTSAFEAFLEALEKQSIVVDALQVDAALAVDCETGAENASHEKVVIVDRHRVATCLHGAKRSASLVRTLLTTNDGADRQAAAGVQCSLMELNVSDSSQEVWLCLDDTAMKRTPFGGRSTEALEVVDADGSVLQLLAASMSDNPSHDLRTGSLAVAGRWSKIHDRVFRCGVALATLLLISCVSLWIDHNTRVGQIEDLQPIRREIYEAAFPGQALPPGAALRVKSERIKLEGLTDAGPAIDGALSTDSLSVFTILHEVTTHIPSSVKVNVDEIRLESSSVALLGRTTSHSAAGEIVQRLNELDSLAVSPPRTKLRKDGTVDFRIRCDCLTGRTNE